MNYLSIQEPKDCKELASYQDIDVHDHHSSQRIDTCT